MILIVVNSLHRDYIELYGEYMKGDELVTMCCDVMYAVKDVLLWINAV